MNVLNRKISAAKINTWLFFSLIGQTFAYFFIEVGKKNEKYKIRFIFTSLISSIIIKPVNQAPSKFHKPRYNFIIQSPRRSYNRNFYETS